MENNAQQNYHRCYQNKGNCISSIIRYLIMHRLLVQVKNLSNKKVLVVLDRVTRELPAERRVSEFL